MTASIVRIVLLNALANGWPMLLVCAAGLVLLVRDRGTWTLPARLAVAALAMAIAGDFLHPFGYGWMREIMVRMSMAERMANAASLDRMYRFYALSWSAWQAVTLGLLIQAVRLALRAQPTPASVR